MTLSGHAILELERRAAEHPDDYPARPMGQDMMAYWTQWTPERLEAWRASRRGGGERS